jgi:actin-like protein 6A
MTAGTMRQPLAGHLLVSQLHHHFSKPTPTRTFPLSLLPRHLISKRDPTPEAGLQPKPLLRDDRVPQTTASWNLWGQNSVVESWKEACGEVVNVRGFDFHTARQLPQALYEFPDGYHQYFGEERYRFTEMLFDPKNYFDQVSWRPPVGLANE